MVDRDMLPPIFYRQFNPAYLLFEAFFDIINIFCSIQRSSEPTSSASQYFNKNGEVFHLVFLFITLMNN